MQVCIQIERRVANAKAQASGNFGAPITAALIKAGFEVTIISRAESSATFPHGIPVIKIPYTPGELPKALAGQDAAVCVVGPGGLDMQLVLVDAAEAAGVKRFIVNDWGWGPTIRGLPEFRDVHAKRRAQWSHARARAEANPGFTWTGITTGNPIDWVSLSTTMRPGQEVVLTRGILIRQ